MAIYPGARVRLIPPGDNDPRIKAIGVILHTDAGNSKSLYGYFSTSSGGVESHFHIPKEFQVEQYRDTAWEADANYHANSFMRAGELVGFISIETQGLAGDPWNAKQLDDIKKLLIWCRDTHKIPLVKCTSATSPGVGWHTMWGSPGPWTPKAKVCPGPLRVKQFNEILVPWMSSGAPAPTPQPPPEETMTPDELLSLMTNTVLKMPGGGTKSLYSCIAEASYANDAFAAVGNVKVPTAKEIADAVVAALPPAPTGALSYDDVLKAVKQGLREGGQVA